VRFPRLVRKLRLARTRFLAILSFMKIYRNVSVFHGALAIALALMFFLYFPANLFCDSNPSASSGESSKTSIEKASQKAFAAFPSSFSGDYVVYRDYSWKNPTWIGFLYYNESTYGAFAITPSTNSNVSVLFSVEAASGRLVLTGQNIISKVSENDVLAVNYLMRLLPDMYTWRTSGDSTATILKMSATSAQNRSMLLPSIVIESRDLPSFGGKVSITFAPEVPVFGLKEITASEGKPILQLERMGRVQSGNDMAFFSFSPIGATKAGVSLSIPANRKKEDKKIDGVTLHLDEQWSMVADNTFFLGNAAALIVDTLDLSLMQIPLESLPLSMVRLFSLSSAVAWSIPSELSVQGSSKRFTVVNLFYDPQSGALNRDVKVCIPSSDGKKCTVISLSVSETAWKANRPYFDSLF
jgi:hypothetical protein